MDSNIILIAKSIHKNILYIKNIIHYEMLLHIGIIIFTAVASAHAHSTYYEEGKIPGINRLVTLAMFIFFYSVTMLIEWAVSYK